MKMIAEAELEAAIASAVARERAAERERCARVCEARSASFDALAAQSSDPVEIGSLTRKSIVAFDCASCIRALPDGGATTAEPQGVERDRLWLAAIIPEGTHVLARVTARVNAKRDALSASSVGGTTTEGGAP